MPHAQFRQFSDAELVTASIDGQKNAFGEIVRRYQGVVSGLVYNRCHGSISHSEDLAQETFLVAWQRLPTMNSSDCLGSWLCGIARNLTRAASRKRTEQPLQKVIEQAVDAASEPSHEAISREQERLFANDCGEGIVQGPKTTCWRSESYRCALHAETARGTWLRGQF